MPQSDSTGRATDYFNDALDPKRSLQLNNRYWKGEDFRHLELLREADDALESRRFRALRKSLRHVKRLLPERYHRSFLSRMVYAVMYSVTFEPIRFSLRLPDEFLRENTYQGSDSIAYYDARHAEALKYVVDLVHAIYRDQYGKDVLRSQASVRYANSENDALQVRMTSGGALSDFHLDEGKDFTAIVYLCRVTSANGCFEYIEGSNSVRKSPILRALHQVVDFDMGLSGASPEDHAHLPLELRGSMALGNYLDEEKVERLSASRVEVTGNAGDGIIFNGFDTIHRGGKPLTGNRTAVFVATRGLINKRLQKAAVDLLAYLWL